MEFLDITNLVNKDSGRLNYKNVVVLGRLGSHFKFPTLEDIRGSSMHKAHVTIEFGKGQMYVALDRKLRDCLLDKSR